MRSASIGSVVGEGQGFYRSHILPLRHRIHLRTSPTAYAEFRLGTGRAAKLTLKMKVVQWDDEPAWSLVQRLAAQHGTGTARQFCHDHGLDPASLTTTRGIEQLAELGGYDAEKLFASSPVNEANGAVRIGRERIASQDAFTSEIRLCPVCIRDDLASERGTPRYRAHSRSMPDLLPHSIADRKSRRFRRTA